MAFALFKILQRTEIRVPKAEYGKLGACNHSLPTGDGRRDGQRTLDGRRFGAQRNTVMSELTIQEIIYDPKLVDSDLQRFRKDTEVLSSMGANLMAKYPKRWVAVYDGKVQTNARSLNQLLTDVDMLGLPRDGIVIQYIDRDVRRMIL